LYHSTLGLRVIKKEAERYLLGESFDESRAWSFKDVCPSSSLLLSSLELRDTNVYEP